MPVEKSRRLGRWADGRRTCRLVANAYDFHQDGNWYAPDIGTYLYGHGGHADLEGARTSAVALKLYASQAGRQGAYRLGWQGAPLDLYAPAEPDMEKTILLDLSATPDYWTPKLTCVCLCAALGMAFPLTVICLWLVSREASAAAGVPHGTSARWAWLGYGLPLLLAGAGYLAVFPPALMSNDSLGQWSQMLSGTYSDVAPAFHTMTNWLITRIWFSPAAVAWTQLLATSLVVAWTLKRLRQWGLSPVGPGRPACCWRSCRQQASLHHFMERYSLYHQLPGPGPVGHGDDSKPRAMASSPGFPFAARYRPGHAGLVSP